MSKALREAPARWESQRLIAPALAGNALASALRSAPADEPEVTIEVEQEEPELFRVRVSDEADWVPLEPQNNMPNALSIAQDMAELFERHGVAVARSGVTEAPTEDDRDPLTDITGCDV